MRQLKNHLTIQTFQIFLSILQKLMFYQDNEYSKNNLY
jgi:hypothetical protein